VISHLRSLPHRAEFGAAAVLLHESLYVLADVGERLADVAPAATLMGFNKFDYTNGVLL
jgi:hypothetical protein